MVTVLLVPTGASLTGVTLIVIVLGVGSSIDAAVGRAAIVLHLEGEGGVGGAVGVGRRRELQQAARDVGDAERTAGRHRHAVVGQACRRRAAW